MILLVGGASCAGKTCFAQRLLERYHIPYLSIDHLKMGLIRGWKDCGSTALSDDAVIDARLWPVLQGIVETALENGQSLVMEGCYLPQREVRTLLERYPAQIQALYLVLSEGYLRRHFSDGLLAHRDDIERRLTPEARDMAAVIGENRAQRALCQRWGLPYLEVQEDYGAEIEAALERFDR